MTGKTVDNYEFTFHDTPMDIPAFFTCVPNRSPNKGPKQDPGGVGDRVGVRYILWCFVK